MVPGLQLHTRVTQPGALVVWGADALVVVVGARVREVGAAVVVVDGAGGEGVRVVVATRLRQDRGQSTICWNCPEPSTARD